MVAVVCSGATAWYELPLVARLGGDDPQGSVMTATTPPTSASIVSKECFGAICATLALSLRLITSAGDATEGMRPSSLADTLL